jgi:hypothetical protein
VKRMIEDGFAANVRNAVFKLGKIPRQGSEIRASPADGRKSLVSFFWHHA